MLLYSLNRPGFNEARRRAIGPIFCALGRVHLVGYKEVKALLTNPQTRGPYLGRAKLCPERCPVNFLLFESNNAPDGAPHRRVREEVFKWVVHRGQSERSQDSTAQAMVAAFAAELRGTPSLLAQGKKAMPVNGTCHVDFDRHLLRKFVVRWTHYVGLGMQLDGELLERFTKLMANKEYVVRRVQLGPDYKEQSSKVQRVFPDEEELLGMYMTSPLLSEYSPSVDFAMDKRAFAELVFAGVAIAGVLGGVTTLGATLCSEINRNSKVQGAQRYNASEAAPTMTDAQLDLFVLEAARRFCPVNHINTVLPEAENVTMGGKRWVLPAGTVVAGNIMTASLDPDGAFSEKPNHFWPGRPGLLERSMNFARIGLGPPEGLDGQTPLAPVACAISDPEALMKEVNELFWSLDHDLNGTLGRQELMRVVSAQAAFATDKCSAETEVRKQAVQNFTDGLNAVSSFISGMDVDRNGRVTENEFNVAWRKQITAIGAPAVRKSILPSFVAAAGARHCTLRSCPGRFLALNMCRDVLRAIHKNPLDTGSPKLRVPHIS